MLITLTVDNVRRRRNRKLIDRLLAAGYSVRIVNNASRFDRR